MKGATLYDLLGKEVDMREKRHNVLSRQLEITEVEQALRSAIKGVDEEIKVPSEKSSQCIFCFFGKWQKKEEAQNIYYDFMFSCF